MRLARLARAAFLPALILARPSLAQEAAPSLATAPALDSIHERIQTEGLRNSKVMDYLDYLTNSIGHRLTGSDNYRLACEWAKREFEAMGLSNVQLHKWGEWKFTWNRGQWSGRVLEPQQIELQVATQAWTAGTRGRRSGRAVKVPPTIDEIEALSGQVADVWFFGRAPGRGASAEERAVWTHFQRFCEDERPLGIVEPSTGDDAYPDRIRVFGSHEMALRANSRLPVVPQIVVRRDQALAIERLLDAGQKVVLEFDIRNYFRREDTPLYNVVAELPGTEKPDEIVIVGGHLDSWHQAAGATDNGTGTTSTMEAARILTAAGAKPKRTIRFCLWGGEEQGLLGSRQYVTQYRTSMNRVSAVFNHDTGTNWAYALTVPAELAAIFEGIVAPLQSIAPPDKDHNGPTFQVRKAEPRPAGSPARGGGGSDHASFLAAGVPAFNWSLKGRSDYFRYTWHSQWDTYDVAIPEYQRHTATVIATVALGVADLPDMLSRQSYRPREEGR